MAIFNSLLYVYQRVTGCNWTPPIYRCFVHYNLHSSIEGIPATFDDTRGYVPLLMNIPSNPHDIPIKAQFLLVKSSNHIITGWWFQFFYFIFHNNIGDNPSHWRIHIFQDGYCTTNQHNITQKMIIKSSGAYGFCHPMGRGPVSHGAVDLALVVTPCGGLGSSESVGGSPLPSGKQPHNYGKSPCWMGKSTISNGPFSIANC